MKLGLLFAGQGSQKAGMGADLYEAYSEFKKVFDEAKVDFDLKEVCFKDENGLINSTRYTQPCMVAFAIGVYDVLKSRGIAPDMVAGLSLGEYSALYAAGVFDAKTAIDTVAFRGKAMEQAAKGLDCAMIAVLGLDREQLSDACKQASDLGVAVIANYNCPGQLVIGGERVAVEKAAELAKEKGAKRCIPLKVSGPFHTPLMKAAGDALREYFKGVTFLDMEIPLVFNCLGSEKSGESIPELLEKQVQSSVFMEDTIRYMEKVGVDTIIEIGPGKVLSGFVKKTAPDLKVYCVETHEDIEAVISALEV